MTEQESKDQALQEYRKKLLQHKEIDAKVRTLREQVKQSKKEYDKTEDDLKALQSVGQIIAEVLRQLDEERCELLSRLQPAHPLTGQHRDAFGLSRSYYHMQRHLLNHCGRYCGGDEVCDACSHCKGQQWPTICGGMPK